MGVFCQNLGITSYNLENYSHFKSKFSLNNVRILERYNYFRTRGNVSFSDLSQLINTLSNQDFAGLDKFNKLINKLNKYLFSMQGVARELNSCSFFKKMITVEKKIF